MRSGHEAPRFSVGVLELLLVQDVTMTALAAVVSYWIRNSQSFPFFPVPLSPRIVGEIILWGTGIGTFCTAVSLGIARGCFGVRTVWLVGRPPLASAIGLTAGSLIVAALLARPVAVAVFG